MLSDSSHKLLTNVFEQLDEFCKLAEEKIDKEQQQLKASKKKTEVETKLAQEMKLNKELTERLAELERRDTELERLCGALENVSISDSDQNRLNNAKENYQIAKELTSIRFDFSAPSNVVKGYIKNNSYKLLQAFELDASSGDISDALWNIIQTATVMGSNSIADKENKRLN